MAVLPRNLPLILQQVRRLKWVGSTHCRLAASGKSDSTGRFLAVSLNKGQTQPDPQQSVITARLQWPLAKYNGRYFSDSAGGLSAETVAERPPLFCLVMRLQRTVMASRQFGNHGWLLVTVGSKKAMAYVWRT